MAGRRGSRPERRDRYLGLRGSGKSREDACGEMGLDPFGTAARQYERWFAAEGGETEPRHPNPFGLSPFSGPGRGLP